MNIGGSRIQRAGCESVVSRRHLLQVGGLGLMGLSLPQLLAAESRPDFEGKAQADSCVLIFLNGGPSHLDLFDPTEVSADELKEAALAAEAAALAVKGVTNSAGSGARFPFAVVSSWLARICWLSFSPCARISSGSESSTAGFAPDHK